MTQTDKKRNCTLFCIIFLCAFAVMMALLMFATSTGNKEKEYDYAIMRLPDDTIFGGFVDEYKLIGDVIKIKVNGDETYLMHTSNCTLVKWAEQEDHDEEIRNLGR